MKRRQRKEDAQQPLCAGLGERKSAFDHFDVGSFIYLCTYVFMYLLIYLFIYMVTGEPATL